MRLVWRRKALSRLEEVKQYIAERNPTASVEVASRLMTVVESLARFPDMGVAGREAGTRELIVPDLPYVIVYRQRATNIEILHVFHTSLDR